MNLKTKQKTLAAFGGSLQRNRASLGWTQAQLAKLMGISIAYLSLLERGRRNPPMTTVVELALHLGVSPARLLPEVI